MKNTLAKAQSNLKCSFDGQVFFYCLPSSYQSLSICIAEGLKQLEIPFYSNVNYWQISLEPDDYLFGHNPSVTPDDCAVVVVEKAWVSDHGSFPENLFHPGRKYVTVYLDDMDGPISPSFYPAARNFDFIFRTHLNNQVEYPANFVPWVFGLSNRIIRETSNLPSFQHRTRHLLANFRVLQDTVEVIFFGDNLPSIPPGMMRINSTSLKVEYPLRQILCNQFLSLIESILPVDRTVDYFNRPPTDSYHYCQWKQTDRRHYPTYYQRLKGVVACAAFGGYVVPGTNSTPTYVEWWDSWRFWESLAAGCATFHVDLDKYGAVLPVMPENWRHYIGIDLDNLEDAVQRLASEPEILERISISGRQWAIENYSPVPTAVRFIETISSNPSGGDTGLLSQGYPLTPSLSVQLSKINIIIFPDWSQEEESVCQELERVIRAIATHPDQSHMTLLVDTSNISDEDAELAISAVMMNLLMEEDLDVAEEPEIALIGKLSDIQWQALFPRLQARIVLENENKQAIALLKAETIPSFELDRFSSERFKQRI
jgi:hypothetical protein